MNSNKIKGNLIILQRIKTKSGMPITKCGVTKSLSYTKPGKIICPFCHNMSHCEFLSIQEIEMWIRQSKMLQPT